MTDRLKLVAPAADDAAIAPAYIEQRSDAWVKIRLGKVTASRLADALARTKAGWGAARANYMAQLVAERLTGTVAETFTSAAMAWGTETEPLARSAYEFYRNVDVVETGFIVHPHIADTGASPDGLIGDDGLLEIKCPNTATHIDTLLGQAIAEKYLTQMQWQMACAGRAWCDFVSFDPRMPESMRLFVRRIQRDEARIAKLEREVTAFLAALDEKLAILRDQYEPPASARSPMAG